MREKLLESVLCSIINGALKDAFEDGAGDEWRQFTITESHDDLRLCKTYGLALRVHDNEGDVDLMKDATRIGRSSGRCFVEKLLDFIGATESDKDTFAWASPQRFAQLVGARKIAVHYLNGHISPRVESIECGRDEDGDFIEFRIYHDFGFQMIEEPAVA